MAIAPSLQTLTPKLSMVRLDKNTQIRHLRIENAELRSLLHKDQRFTAACYAMQGILANEVSPIMPPSKVAAAAVACADALLAALEEEKNDDRHSGCAEYGPGDAHFDEEYS